MTKYSDEFKLKVVKAYLEGCLGYMLLAREFNVRNEAQIKRCNNQPNSKTIEIGNCIFTHYFHYQKVQMKSCK